LRDSLKSYLPRRGWQSLLAFLLLFVLLVPGISCVSLGVAQNPAGGTLNLSDDGPITLDPAAAVEAGSISYIFQIFSGLVRLDENLEIVPDIAQSWDKSSDGKTFTFHLRQDAEFHSGKPVTASDFKYSWERALNPATGSQTAGTYLNDIAGAADILAGNTSELSGVKVEDDYTLKVTLDSPKAYFLYKMAFPISFVLDRDNVESGSSWFLQPNGTGPFKLGEWQAGQLLVLERNDNFYGTKASLDQVVFHLLSGSSMQQYQSGDVDVTFVSADYMGLVSDPSNPVSLELHQFPELSVYYIGFNISEPPFDDVNVRQAFSYAVDKERLVTLALKDVVLPAYTILPPGIPGNDSGLEGLRFDPDKARELISASKYGDVSQLPPVQITAAGYAGSIGGLIGGVIEEWRRNLGVEVTVRQIETQNFLYALKEEKDEAFISGWVADYPDPQNFLDVLFRTGEQNNYGDYSNPELDALLDDAAVGQDVAARMAMYHAAEQILVSDAAVLPLFFGQAYILVKPYVKNYVWSPLGYPLLYKVSIEK
jgi:oligopeptide transport system substrate-binding protein